MSQKVEIQKGRPKGLPKTGGRQRGVPNKKNVRMRELFAQEGFEFHKAFIEAYQLRNEKDYARLDALKGMAPYFMQRLKEESEDVPTPPIDVTPEEEALTDEELLAIASAHHPSTRKTDPSQA